MNTFTSTADDLGAPRDFPWIADGLAYGGDYSPEQWPEEVWPEDIALMREAGVNTVNLGVFSWGLLEVADDVFEWGWLDRIMDLLHEGGVGVNLATPTAAPPIWLLQAHPEIATVDAMGVRVSQGGRLAWSPSSATFRRYALRVVRAIAERYGSHPALRLWHVSNELGNENARSYDDETGAAFQRWLAERHRSVDALNEAWGSAFWGHHYTAFEQVQPPRFASTGHNPGLLLDFERFTSDALLGYYEAERAVLREVTPDIPITTNFMVMNEPGVHDYARWAKAVDVVANDHYTIGADPHRAGELAFSADRTRGIAAGEPWLLIEHSTAAVNWQGVNRAKGPGEMRRDTLAHIARGADGAMFFQWRASTAGSEQFHSSIVPHAGADSTIFRDAAALGSDLASLARVRGSRVERAKVAILYDQLSAAALRSGRNPSNDISSTREPIAMHRALTDAGVAVDVLPSDAALDDYAVVLVPTLFLAPDGLAERLDAFVTGGGHLLVGYSSGIVDETNRVIPGGYPGAFREALGIRSDEHFPQFAETVLRLDSGATAGRWVERVEARDAEVLARFDGGDFDGWPAVTVRRVGSGSARYLATSLDDDGLARLLADVVADAGVAPVVVRERGLDAVRRVGDGASYLFLINQSDRPRTAEAGGVDLLTGATHTASVTVEAGAVVVLEETR